MRRKEEERKWERERTISEALAMRDSRSRREVSMDVEREASSMVRVLRIRSDRMEEGR